MRNLEGALAYLNRSRAFHMNMIDPLLHGDAELCYGARDGALIRERRSGAYMMSAGSDAAAEAMLGLVDACATFVCHQPRYAPEAQRKFGLHNALACAGVAYLAEEDVPVRGLYEIVPLTMEQLGDVRALYHNVDDEAYIRARIESGELWGAFEAGRLLGFIGIHAEWSMGMLEVLPAERRRGVGSELEGWLINRVRAQGRTPFGQIFVENAPSLELQRRLGVTVSQERMMWLC